MEILPGVIGQILRKFQVEESGAKWWQGEEEEAEEEAVNVMMMKKTGSQVATFRLACCHHTDRCVQFGRVESVQVITTTTTAASVARVGRLVIVIVVCVCVPLLSSSLGLKSTSRSGKHGPAHALSLSRQLSATISSRSGLRHLRQLFRLSLAAADFELFPTRHTHALASTDNCDRSSSSCTGPACHMGRAPFCAL